MNVQEKIEDVIVWEKSILLMISYEKKTKEFNKWKQDLKWGCKWYYREEY